MSGFATGSGILLCPKGPTYSTISTDTWQDMVDSEAANGGKRHELSPELFSLWFANCKTLEFKTETHYVDPDPDFNEDVEVTEVAHQFPGVGSGALLPAANSSAHPYPANIAYSDPTSIHLLGADATFPPFIYALEGGGGINAIHFLLPSFFIWQDKFYAFRAYGVANFTHDTISTTQMYIRQFETYGDGSTFEAITTIKPLTRFYS